MVERSLSMREVRGAMPRISKTLVTHQMVITSPDNLLHIEIPNK